MNVLMVGGKFDAEGGRPSGLVTKLAEALKPYVALKVVNGGHINDLQEIHDLVSAWDAVLWWPDVPNDLPKLRDVKKSAPHTILVTSKNNLESRYSAQALVAHGLALKANLMVIFEGTTKQPPYLMQLMDPLGNVHSDLTKGVNRLAVALVHRLTLLKNLTRMGSEPAGGPVICPPDDPEFFQVVRNAAEDFHRLLDPGPDVQRMLGNASFRCAHGFPAVRGDGGTVFVSKRNVDKREASSESFVQVWMDGKSLRYNGVHKPSVDAPIQVRLFEAFPKINYMLHGHVYVRSHLGVKTTSMALPCGVLEEVVEVINLVPPDATFAMINLRGHGCLIMASEARFMQRLEFQARPHYERQLEWFSGNRSVG